jgi:serine-type D-Ala-D-Ala carboxypeptidase
VLIAARENQISIEESLAKFLPDFHGSDKRDITIRQLLNHTSGIEIAVQSLINEPCESWTKLIAAAPLGAAPGHRVLYSCTNYFLLARLVELWTQQKLDDFIAQRIFAPLGFSRTGFFPLRNFAPDQIAPTEILQGDEPLVGVVHDEAARAWENEQGSAGGNAGMFGTADELARFCRLWLQDGAWENVQILHPHDVHFALRDTVRAESYNQGIGWHCDVPTWAAPPLCEGIAGHAGFTGPTMFIAPRTKHICIILNNRVYPTRNGPNRFPFHRQIARWMFEQS